MEDIFKQVKAEGYTLDQIVGCGVTNQRETTIAWNPKTGKPYYNAIVWCDTRTKDIADKWTAKYGQNNFKKTVGLNISTYFSAFKIRWMIENVKEIGEAKPEDLVFGTIDTWIIYNLTKGKSYYTDVTNASRMFLMDLKTLDWDEGMLKTFGL
jgi:glycerol kinase